MAVDTIDQKDSKNTNMAVKIEKLPNEVDKSGTIHSGHFMVSRVHDVNNDDDEVEVSPFSSPDQKGFNFTNASRETQTNYNFGNASIDSSLTKMFECMTLAYSGTISSPRWKQFRGLHVTQKERIRLNNLIWREWHMQYIYHRSPLVCQFASPLSDDIHCRPEAVVLEGKYWKRRLDTVTSEYKKCRRYFKERINQQRQLGVGQWREMPEWELLEKVKDVTFLPTSTITQMSSTDLNITQSDMTEDMDFNNELFATFNNQPFAFPNPRELSQSGYSEWIQPGLVQLQPNLEEFMDIDSMQELLSNTKFPPSSFFTDPSVTPLEMQTTDNSDMTFVDFLTGATSLNNDMNGNGSTANTDSMAAMEAAGVVIPNPALMSNNASLIIQQQQQQQQQQSQQAILNASLLQQQQLINSPANNMSLQHPTNVNTIGDPVSILLNNSGQMSGNVTIMPQRLAVSQRQQQQQQPHFIITTQPSDNVTIMSNIADLYNTNTVAISTGSIMGTVNLTPSLSPSTSISSLPMVSNNTNVNNSKVGPQVKNSTILPHPNRQHHLQPFQPKLEPQSQPNVSSLTSLLQSQPKPSNTKQSSPLAQALANTSSLLNLQSPQTMSQGSGRTSISSRKPRGKHHSGGDGRKQGASNCIVLSNASGMITDLAALAQSNSNSAISTVNNKKKDGSFAVPSVVPRKPRTIAPAPVAPATPPPPPQQSSSESYLAQLLRKGTYPGALISVKKEPQSIPATTASPMTAGRPTIQHTALSSQLPLLTRQLQTSSIPVVGIQSSTHCQIPRCVTAAPTTVPVVANIGGVSQNVIDISNMSHKELTSILNAISSPQVKRQSSPTPPTTPSIKEAFSPSSIVASPPSSLLPASPPITIKRSPSPSVDMGSLSEPSSPFTSIPMSPSSADDSSQTGDSPYHRENKKAAHLSAEQKRRFNLKMGFDLLQKLVPSLSQNPKVSKATMLQKTADYCKKLKLERSEMRTEAAVLKQEIESLNSSISNVQSQLPETGVPVTRQRKDQMKEMFDEYVRTRTIDNWKFWIFSVIMSCLYDSYSSTVSTTSLEEMYRTSLTWVDQSCSLVTLRPNVLNALRKLSTTTSILTEPNKVKEEAIQNVSKPANPRSNLGFLL